jgi:hypothetical protein
MHPPPGHLRSQYQHQQHQYQRPATINNAGGGGGAPSSIVGAAQAAAAAISAGKAPPGAATSSQRPAYISVATGSQMTAAPGSRVPALNPQNWPPAVKSYVERAFKAAPFRQRTKLQDVLRMLINDAQEKGKESSLFVCLFVCSYLFAVTYIISYHIYSNSNIFLFSLSLFLSLFVCYR